MGAILESALEYAEAGLAVFPVKRSDKSPYTSHGLKEASKDADTIRRWWKQFPDANIGIACGEASGGLLVVDVDIKPSENKHGDEYLKSWEALHGDFPQTVCAKTGSGGLHIYLKAKNLDQYKNTVDAIPGVDIRGDGAYVVAPPSVYADGRTYEWQRGISASETEEIAEANQSVYELLDLNRKGEHKPQTSAKRSVRQVAQGQRNVTLFRYCCLQRGQDVPYEAALAGARAFCAEWNPPLSDAEIVKTLNSAYNNYQPNEQTIYGDAPEPEPEEDELNIKTLDEFVEQDVQWLIRGYIPKEQITLMCGTGGTGKTSVWVSLVASLSAGERTLFDGDIDQSFIPPREPQRIMFFSGEDTIEHVIKKRLHAQHANMKNIVTVSIDDSRFDKVRFGSKFLERLIAKYRPTLCVFDPLQSFIDPRVKMSDRNAMRQSMRCLIEWGKKYGTTFLIVMHTNKLLNVWGRNRMADSADLWDIARCVLMVGDTEDDGIKYLSHEKNNYGMTGKTMLFKNERGNPTFHGWTESKDREFVIAQAKTRNATTNKSSLEDVKEMILSELEERPDGMASSDLDDLLREIGFKSWSIQRAKSELKKDKKIGYHKTEMNGAWIVKKL